ncbi:hypothetical protein [Mobiluncus curtisii]|uniref:hypothetical protein n=1 Tax=Mobiluncus curtisii TaxID=2051 RepID=UPI0014703B65|nr:hypothetical protein [Mobiluncus curtisii]NMW48988.1 hypothetical protein [Mobiluncus curtisii]NMW89103.1 hypothetical protein [Mobiluncus curtisii]
MIDTATLEAPIISATTLVALASLLSALIAAYFLTAAIKLKDSGPLDNAIGALFLILAIAGPVVMWTIVPTGAYDKKLVFNNNVGSIQAIEGEKPIIQVLEQSKTRVVSVPCVFVTNKEKQRHDCTFVNRGGGSFEVWDTTTFRQIHPRPNSR